MASIFCSQRKLLYITAASIPGSVSQDWAIVPHWQRIMGAPVLNQGWRKRAVYSYVKENSLNVNITWRFVRLPSSGSASSILFSSETLLIAFLQSILTWQVTTVVSSARRQRLQKLLWAWKNLSCMVDIRVDYQNISSDFNKAEDCLHPVSDQTSNIRCLRKKRKKKKKKSLSNIP